VLKAFRSSEEDRVRRKIIVALVACIVAVSLVISMNSFFDSFVPSSISSGIALALAIIVVVKQRASGLFGKTHVALAIGLSLWLAGQVIWSYQVMYAGQEPSGTSIADIPWLALYIPFAYYIFTTYKWIGKTVSKYSIVLVAGVIAALTFNNIYLTYSGYEKNIAKGQDDTPSFAAAIVRSTYPIGDAIIVVPAILILIALRRGLLTYTPWLFAASALALIAAGDMIFANMALLGRPDLSRFAYAFYNAGDLAFAGGLYWYNRFVIFNEKRAFEEFQRANR
jgi:hypothetical protein